MAGQSTLIRVFTSVLAIFSVLSPASHVAAQDRNGFAFNAGLGASQIRDEDGAETFQGTSFAYSFGIEYRFKSRLALGFEVFDLGTADDTVQGVATEIEVRGFEFTARQYFGDAERAEPFVLLGAAVYSADVEPGGNNGLFGDDAWVVGGGIDYYFAPTFAWRFEGRFFNGPRDESAGLLTAGFVYRF